MFVYEEGDLAATLVVSSANLVSVNANWVPQFVNLEGPWKLLRKRVMVFCAKLERCK